MAKVSELFNKVDELDSPNADVNPISDVFIQNKNVHNEPELQHSSSEEDEILKDLISQKSKLED